MALTISQAVADQASLAYLGRPQDVGALTAFGLGLVSGGPTAAQLATLFASTESKVVFGANPTLSSVIAKSFDMVGRVATTQNIADIAAWATTNNLAISQMPWEIMKIALSTESLLPQASQVAWARLALAYQFSEDVTANPNALQNLATLPASQDAARAVITSVTSYATIPTGVTGAAAFITGASTVAGSTFTLTSGVDTLTGTGGNDTFIADNTNAAATSAADSINGGAGTDTLKIFSKAATADTLPTTLTSIENLWVNNSNTTGLDVSSTGISNLELNTLGGTGLTYTVNAQSVTLSDLATAVANVTIAGNTSTAQTLTLSKYGTAAGGNVNLTGTKAAALTITSTGAVGTGATGANKATIVNAAGVAVSTVTINGSSALVATLGNGATAGFASGGITSIDASAATAVTNLTVTGAGTAGQTNLATTFSYKGGTASDTLDIAAGGFVAGAAVTAAQLKLMTIDGGAGNDTLIINNTIATGTTSLTNLTSIETIGVNSANGTINMTNFNGATGVLLQGTNGGAVTVNALPSSGTLIQGTSVDGGNALAVNAVGTGTADALTWSIGTAAANGVAAAALGTNTGAITISGYETVNLTSQGAANTFGAGGITVGASAGGSVAMTLAAGVATTFAGALTLTGASQSLAISGSGAVVITGVLTAGTLTNTGTGAFTATANNIVLNADFSANTKAVSFTTAATSAAILKGGAGNTTFVATGFNDTITVGGGTNSVTGGNGADNITIVHTAATTITTIVQDSATASGTATGFAASTAVPTAAFSTTTMDIVTGFKAGDTVSLTGVTAAGTLLSNASTTGAATVGDVILVRGTYSSSANTFTAGTSGADSALVYDDNGTTAGGNYDAIILVGYIDSGAADTVAAGPAAVFTANA